MELNKIIHNTEQRFKTAESKNINKYLINRVKGFSKSIIRGGVLGGAFGYFVGGDADSFFIGAGIGSALDGVQDTIRLIGLMNMYHKNNIKEFNLQKQSYKELGWIN